MSKRFEIDRYAVSDALELGKELALIEDNFRAIWAFDSLVPDTQLAHTFRQRGRRLKEICYSIADQLDSEAQKASSDTCPG